MFSNPIHEFNHQQADFILNCDSNENNLIIYAQNNPYISENDYDE